MQAFLFFLVAFFFWAPCALAGVDHDGSLLEAAKRGDLRLYKMMLDFGARPHATDSGGNNAMLMAVYGGNRLVLRDLIERKVDVNSKGSLGATPLGLAVIRADTDVVRLLLKAGANPDIKDAAGTPPLLAAIELNHAPIIGLLLAAGANPNLPDANGRTPLMAAAANGLNSTVDDLLRLKADLNSRDSEGRNALYWSILEKHGDIAKVLLAAGAESRRLVNGYSPLHWARVMQNDEVVAVLEHQTR